MSSSGFNLEKFLIPLEEIKRATKSFSSETYLGEGSFGKVYRGQLSERWKNCTAAIKCLESNETQGKDQFRRELKMISDCDHQNIISFIGYCDEGDKMIIVSEYASNGSLDDHLEDPEKISCITWAQRLKICLGVARGLSYLHSGLGDDNRVIHRDVKSGNILLNDNLEAKICDFGLSRSGPRNQPHTQVYTDAGGTDFYIDPIYRESGILRKESDLYSFGVVLFEMLTGILAYQRRSYGDGKQQYYLINLVRQLVDRYSVDKLDELIDPHIKDHIDMGSSRIFKEIAYQCISMDLDKRPTVARIIEGINEALNIQKDRDASTTSTRSQQCRETIHSLGLDIEKILIPQGEIRRATNNFSSETQIGAHGSGTVYRGQLSERWQNRTADIKRLSWTYWLGDGLGDDVFLNELNIISRFHHQNIIHFIGYCVDDNEFIIVLEHAINGRLDQHLRDPNKRRFITWPQRLKICLGVAIGLNHLHSGLGNDNSIIHRDVKSANVMLDDNLEAKICDFGVSILCPRDQVSGWDREQAPGTPFYIDPIYRESGIIRKESDVYSFGVILFEMLSGMLAYHKRSYGDGEPQVLINLVQHYYDNGLDKLIDPHIKDHIVIGSYDTFKEIAYKCISLNLKERPTMDDIIKRIRKALNIQETVPALIECLMKDIGFSQGKPVAAFTIYKCLLHWKSFETERTIVFDRLVYMFDLAIQKEDTVDNMAYWLSNVSALLFLIQGNLKSDDASSTGFNLPPSSASIAEAVSALEVVQAVAKYTALSFKQKLTEYVEYMYDIIRDNLIKELGSLLTLCIQSPRTPRRVLIPGQIVGKYPKFHHWQGIVECVNTLLNTMKDNFVPAIILGKIFSQLFSYINVQVFHSILLYPECCTFRNGEYVETGLKELQQWCWQAKEEYVSSAMEKLMHLGQAVTLLVTLNQKNVKKSFVEISEDICPSLSLQQIYRICTIYRDENNNIPDITQHVISSIMLGRTKDFRNEDINSFILEDCSSEPFSVDDLFTSFQAKDFSGVEPPTELAKYSALQFLYD